MDNKLKIIASKCKGAVSLNYREYSSVYDTLDSQIDYNKDNEDTEYIHAVNFLDGELEKCLKSDEYWCLHFYPNTPVGFYHAFSHDLDKLLDWALGILSN